MDIKGKTAIITGSGAGVGRETAREFARQGARLVCCDLRGELACETVRLIESEGGEGLALSTDVTDKSQVDAMVKQTCERFGSVDILFNNAGSFNCIGALWEVDADSWWRDVTVNLRGPMLCCKAVLPGMMSRNEGIIINMYGGGATWPLAGGSGYGSSKAALLRLTDTLARELESVGSAVMVFAMAPGLVRTEMTELQVTTEAGKQWLAGTADAFDAGQATEPDQCGKDSLQLIRHARPELSGRIFIVGMDFADIARNADEIKANDRMTMRPR
jgi:NAD(P)-dependent dehydrogenase (short-subunit alcohol dehydrogenase family)